MKKLMIMAVPLAMLTGCGNHTEDYDATGTFEATETTVSAEQGGTLLAFDVDEGDALTVGQEVGLVDTTQLCLAIRQLEVTKEVYQSQKPDHEAQVAAMRQQLRKAEQEQQRYRELVADGAAPSKLLDDANSQVEVLRRQLAAQTSTLSTQTRALDKQAAAADVQISQLRDQLSKCHIAAPTAGTVVEKYVERGEFVAPGRPLFKVATTQQMFLRAYVTSAQLRDIRLGQTATVFADFGDGQRRTYEGRVSWISSRSEFTPKTILTDDERADLVYAVKVTFENDGYVKIGMYGEVKF